MENNNETTRQIDLNKLRERELFIMTPAYGGMVSAFYSQALLNLSNVFNKYGLKYNYFSLVNESLITRARNYCVDEFLRSSATDLLFIDADIQFKPEDVLGLWSTLAENPKEYDIIGGTYPKKNISWEKIKKAVDKGFADKNPAVLEHFAGDFVFNPLKSGEINLMYPVEVLETGTGFMMIQRETFEKLQNDHPEWMYKPDHVRNKNFDGKREICMFFQDPIDEVSRRQLSEDYFFCQQARKSNMKVWICPWINLNHTGTYNFVGNIQAIAAIGAAATADLDEIEKMKG